MSTITSTIHIRPALRADIPTLSTSANAGNAHSALHHLMAPNQSKYPLDYHSWRLNITKTRFSSPDVRTMIAEDINSKQFLGQAAWAIEGSETNLYKRWTSESTWSDWIETHLLWLQGQYRRYLLNRSIDYTFLNASLSNFFGEDRNIRPPCLHLHMIVVDPIAQSRGVGRLLVDWGKELALKEELPIFLEATLEAVGFYERIGFRRLGRDVVIRPEGCTGIEIPAFVWEGDGVGRDGRWLVVDQSWDGEGVRWRWRDDVLPK